ncbi:MAG: SH3 domain-containing protein [Bacteroidota bacterium]
MPRQIGLLFLLFFGLQLGYPQTPAERAQRAYQQQVAKDYATAIAAYESLLTDGYTSADLHLNLGLAYYRNDQLGPAIWQLEKARKLRPYDAEIDKNLQLIRNEQEDGLLPLPAFFLRAWWQSLAARLSVNAWGILALLLLFSGVGALGARLWYRRQTAPPAWWSAWQSRLLPLGLATLLLAFCFAGLAGTRQQVLNTQHYGVVLPAQVTLRVAPDQAADATFEVHTGLHARLLDEFENWVKIGLVDGREGWLPSEAVGKI